MGNLNLILFISFAAPLLMALFVCRGKARTLLTFLFIGTVVCLFCGEFSAIIMKLLLPVLTFVPILVLLHKTEE